MAKYHIVSQQDLDRAGMRSLWSKCGASAPEPPQLGTFDLPGEHVPIQQAELVFIVGPSGLQNLGGETLIDAEEMDRFIKRYKLSPSQIVVLDVESGHIFFWNSPAPTVAENEARTGVRLSVGEISRIHGGKMEPIYEALKAVRFARTMPRTVHSSPGPITLAVPDLGGDFGGEDEEPQFDVVVQTGNRGMQHAAMQAVQRWARATERFAPGQAAELFADYATKRQMAAMSPMKRVGFEEPIKYGDKGAVLVETGSLRYAEDAAQVEKAKQDLIANNEAANKKLHFSARVENYLDGAIMRSAKAVMVASDKPELPRGAWDAFSAGRPVVLVAPPDVKLPFQGRGINYDAILFHVRPNEMKKLGKLTKLWLNMMADKNLLGESGKWARDAYERAQRWPELLMQSLTTT